MTHHELGDFLRACRAQVDPQDAGLPVEARARRVSGLRREEVAMLAGMSVDYYTRLEQGRHTSPSDAVLDALARVLRLDAAGRQHLADLAHPARSGGGASSSAPAQTVRPAMRQLLASFVDHPAFVVGRRTDVLAANALACALMTDWPRLPRAQRNYTRWLLLDPAARERYLDWDTVAAEAVGTLRLDAGRHPDDPQRDALVEELTVKSTEFRTWWTGHRVHERTHGTKRLRHPEIGDITIRFEALALPGDADQTLFVYTTDPGSRSHDNLRLLASWAADRASSSSRRRSPASELPAADPHRPTP